MDDVKVDNAGDLWLLDWLVVRSIDTIALGVDEPDCKEQNKEWCEAIDHDESRRRVDVRVERVQKVSKHSGLELGNSLSRSQVTPLWTMMASFSILHLSMQPRTGQIVEEYLRRQRGAVGPTGEPIFSRLFAQFFF